MRLDLSVLLHRTFSLLWCLSFFAPISSAFAGGLTLQDGLMRVQAAVDGTYVEGLAVNIGNDSHSATPEWVSLVTRSKNETLSRHFSIQGVDWDQNTLRQEVEEAGLVTSIMSRDGRLELRKRLETLSGQRRFKLGLEFINHSSSPLVLNHGLGLQLGPGLGEYPVAGFGIADTLYSYVEPVIYSREKGLQRFPFDKDAADGVYDVNSASWAGLQSRYFALLLMPEGQQTLDRVRVYPGSESVGLPQRYLPKLVLEFEPRTLLPGGKIERSYLVYAGPKSKDALVGEGYDFSELLFPELWQWMRSLSFALLGMLGFLHGLIPSWGLAIIVLAVGVRLLMYPLAQRSLKSHLVFMAVQKAMKPELTEIKKNYKGGEQSERILQLYEQHGVSPLAGLKPLLMILLQIPIFVALFNVLGQVFELREASFLWIDTLAEPDRLFALGFEVPLLGSYFNLLPVLMALSTFLMMVMSAPPTSDGDVEKRQLWPMLLMTVSFFVLFYTFPAGMVLYWTMANFLHMMQQWIVGLSSRGRV